jgi:hypothetical protein
VKIQTDPIYGDLWEKDRVIKAEWLIWVCSDPKASKKITLRGIEIVGARIEEKVDLDCALISFPLRFFTCAFAKSVSLTGTRLPFLDLGGSSLRGLQAKCARIECSVILNNVKDQGEVELDGATIGGDLSCNGGQVINARAKALCCDGAKIAGNVFLRNGFRADG